LPPVELPRHFDFETLCSARPAKTKLACAYAYRRQELADKDLPAFQM
jgi:hypothetical protein